MDNLVVLICMIRSGLILYDVKGMISCVLLLYVVLDCMFLSLSVVLNGMVLPLFVVLDGRVLSCYVVLDGICSYHMWQ